MSNNEYTADYGPTAQRAADIARQLHGKDRGQRIRTFCIQCACTATLILLTATVTPVYPWFQTVGQFMAGAILIPALVTLFIPLRLHEQKAYPNAKERLRQHAEREQSDAAKRTALMPVRYGYLDTGEPVLIIDQYGDKPDITGTLGIQPDSTEQHEASFAILTDGEPIRISQFDDDQTLRYQNENWTGRAFCHHWNGYHDWAIANQTDHSITDLSLPQTISGNKGLNDTVVQHTGKPITITRDNGEHQYGTLGIGERSLVALDYAGQWSANIMRSDGSLQETIRTVDCDGRTWPIRDFVAHYRRDGTD